ncbi:HPP family protein [Pseudoalteromonas sp. T1lg10]|uniref:HPP family protein n=1 Tax=Pseudoalteromonas sp. T1lg10 TaxID=2077093 RepID=UPI000CF6A89A|nr:HPP family protein [Pseudoalteromonas sp. T1lg10]
MIKHVIAGFGAAIAIGVLAYLDSLNTQMLWLMAPFGATTVLVFGVPNSPLARAKNVILGHLVTAFIGVVFSLYAPITPLSMAIATGLAVSLMLVSDTTHPPAGANPVLIMLAQQGWMYLLSPVLIGAVLIVLLASIQRRVVARFEALPQH